MRLSTLLFLSAPILLAADAVSPGRFVVERPTLICVGFEWRIAGDDNRNAIVEVSYRKGGENSWKQGMPLFWFGGEKVFRKGRRLHRGRDVRWQHSGTWSRTPSTKRAFKCEIRTACAARRYTQSATNAVKTCGRTPQYANSYR